MKFALAIYFGSFTFAILWTIWFAGIATGLVDTSDKVDPWPLVLAAAAMIAAKFALRLMAKKAAPNG